MNLHSIPPYRPPLALMAEYLQFRYGWVWRVTPDNANVEFRTDESARWIQLGAGELAGYEDDFTRWRVANPVSPPRPLDMRTILDA